MAKPKQLVRPPKKQKAPANPITPDDFQDAADLHEETGGKWRAGDPAKSSRAFVRAIDVYNAGLQKHPQNFDLAYNKARLQLEITQQPAIIAQLRIPLIDLLQETLLAHRHALSLNDTDPNILFNTAQVLTALAEQHSYVDRPEDAVPLLHEALELLSTTLSRQEMMLEQHRADFANVEHAEDGGGVPLEADETPAMDDTETEEEQSVRIEVPVSPQDLLDTVTASLTALTTLTALADASSIQTLGDMAASLTEKKAPTYLSMLPAEEQTGAQFALALSRATFVGAFADAQFNALLIDLQTYSERFQAFDFAGKEADATALGSEAEARTELVHSVLARDDSGADTLSDICWRQLSTAQDLYAKAVRIESSAKTYLCRGDVEMLRHGVVMVSRDGKLADSKRNSGPLLLKNAQTYYRGAIKLAAKDGGDEARAAESRLVVASALERLLYPGDSSNAGVARGEQFLAAIRETVEDGLLASDLADRLVQASQP